MHIRKPIMFKNLQQLLTELLKHMGLGNVKNVPQNSLKKLYLKRILCINFACQIIFFNKGSQYVVLFFTVVGFS